jgi:hypothetical protein
LVGVKAWAGNRSAIRKLSVSAAAINPAIKDNGCGSFLVTIYDEKMAIS